MSYDRGKWRDRITAARLALTTAVALLIILWINPLVLASYYNVSPPFNRQAVTASIEVSGGITGVDHDQRIIYAAPSDSFTVTYRLRLPAEGFYIHIDAEEETSVNAYVLGELCGLSRVLVARDGIIVNVTKINKTCNMSVIVSLVAKAALLREYMGAAYPAVVGLYEISDLFIIREANDTAIASSVEIAPIAASYRYDRVVISYYTPVSVLIALLIVHLWVKFVDKPLDA